MPRATIYKRRYCTVYTDELCLIWTGHGRVERLRRRWSPFAFFFLVFSFCFWMSVWMELWLPYRVSFSPPFESWRHDPVSWLEWMMRTNNIKIEPTSTKGRLQPAAEGIVKWKEPKLVHKHISFSLLCVYTIFWGYLSTAHIQQGPAGCVYLFALILVDIAVEREKKTYFLQKETPGSRRRRK